MNYIQVLLNLPKTSKNKYRLLEKTVIKVLKKKWSIFNNTRRDSANFF